MTLAQPECTDLAAHRIPEMAEGIPPARHPLAAELSEREDHVRSRIARTCDRDRGVVHAKLENHG